MKKCITCHEEKGLSSFNRNTKKKDGLQDRCRQCDNAANRDWYQKNKDRAKERSARNNLRYREEMLSWIKEYLLVHPCVDCGEGDPVVLDFDHLRDKTQNISTLLQRRHKAALKSEVEKCEVVCANCHRRRTSQRQGWNKLTWV